MALSLAIDTKEKRNLAILLGLMAALIVGVLVVYVVLPMLSGGGDEAATPTPIAKNDTPPAAATGPGAGGAPGGPAGAPPAGAPGAAGAPVGGAAAPAPAPAGAAGAVSARAVSMPFGRPRPDPFEPYYVRIPDLPPEYDPERSAPPPPPPPIPVPQPSNVFVAPLPIPGGGGGSAGTTMIGMPRPPVFSTLPPVQIPQLVVAPSVPRLQGGSSQPGVVSRASDRRVSGVLIGDSVRAILEIGEGQQKVTRIVQPGDEVDGIRILRIERIRENGTVVTRMIISEAGEERFVELTPSSEPNLGIGTTGGGGPFTAPPAGQFGTPPAGGNPFGTIRGAQ